MKYELEKEDMSKGYQMFKYVPWYMKLGMKLVLPKNLSKVKDMKKWLGYHGKNLREINRTGIVEYLNTLSKTDEHHVRVYESSDCWRFENVGTALAM